MKLRRVHYRQGNDQERLLLTKRKGIYYLRWCLSDYMARILWTDELRYSLRTRDKKLAQYMCDIIKIQITPHLRAVAREHQQHIHKGSLRDQLKIALRYMISDMLEDHHFMSAAKWRMDGGKLNSDYADIIPFLPPDMIPDALYDIPPHRSAH